MFETTIHVDRKAEAVLEHARTQRRIAQQAEAEVLAAALAWAHLHPCAGLLDHPDADADGNTSTTVLGGLEREIPLAGEGTPTVGEFAIAEFAAALGMSTDAGRCPGPVRRRHRARAGPPRMGQRVLAVQAALPHPG